MADKGCFEWSRLVQKDFGTVTGGCDNCQPPGDCQKYFCLKCFENGCEWDMKVDGHHHLHPALRIVKANGYYGIVPSELSKTMKVSKVAVYYSGVYGRIIYLRTLAVAVTSPRLYCAGC